MQHDPQQADSELQAAEALDAWITARLNGREELASLPNLAPEEINLTALTHDLISLAEEIQPAEEFVIHLAASIRWTALHRYIAKYPLPSFPNFSQANESVVGELGELGERGE